ncbi:MAG: hypothetical protein PUB32_00175 [Clostridiales bacterium]|nr:hypothetical protein [Clostridiales bacterium]
MLKAFKNEFRLSGKTAIFSGVFTLGMYIFGYILLTIVLAIDPEEDTTFFPMGSLMAVVGAVIGQMMYDGASFSTNYSLAVAMSQRRLPQIFAHFLVSLLRMAVVASVVYLLMMLDELVAHSIYAGRDMELDPRALVSPGSLAAFIIVPVVFALFVASVKLRFGTRGWTVMYFIIIFGSIPIPRLVDMAIERPEHPVSKVLRAVFMPIAEVMTPALGIALAVAAAVIILLVSIRLYMRAQVSIY